MMYRNTNPVQPTYSAETIAAINKAIEGKAEILWETEKAIVDAILTDTVASNLQKASEISRSMNRFIGNVQGLNSAALPFPVYGENMAAPGGSVWGGYGNFVPPTAPRAHNYSFMLPNVDGTTDEGDAVNFVMPCDQFDKYQYIDVFINGTCVTTLGLSGIVDNLEDRNYIGISVMMPSGHLGDLPEFKDAVFSSLMGALDQMGETDKYGYTIRDTPAPGLDPEAVNKVFYLDLLNSDDPVEAESFSDLISGNISAMIAYDVMFPSAA